VALGVVVANLTRRDAPGTGKVSSGTAEVAPPKPKIEEGLRDAPLLDLIKNARVATRKGDQVTRTAMVAGLKKEPERAKSLIQREIAKTKDPTDQEILTKIGSEIP